MPDLLRSRPCRLADRSASLPGSGRVLSAILAALILAGCASSTGIPEAPPRTVATPEQTQAAAAAISATRSHMMALGDLPPAERYARSQAMGSELIDDLQIAANTRFENQALYWLACWRFQFRHGDGVDLLLDRLDQCPSPVLKDTFGTWLRIQLRLRQGRVREARDLAEPLAATTPELRPVLDLVRFYETIGQPAPHVHGADLLASGGPTAGGEPIASREPWLLYIFARSLDGDTLFLFDRYAAAIAAAGMRDQVRIVVVDCSADLLPAQASLQSRSATVRCSLIPVEGADIATWRDRWRFPLPLPHTALVGAQRTIMAVELDPDQLAGLLGRAASGG
jgi:hypothetical protein